MRHMNPYNRRSFRFHMKIMNLLILRTVTTVQLKKSPDSINPTRWKHPNEEPFLLGISPSLWFI